MNRGIFRGVIAAFVVLGPMPSTGAFAAGEASLRQMALQTHNDVRARMGVAPIQWDEGLAQSALGYASQMARTDRYGHDTTPGRRRIMGENIWRGTRGAFSYRTMLGVMVAEGRRFRPGVFPNVSTSGRWWDVGHFTQMTWPTTAHVGCAVASSARYDYLVCRYSPPGNKDGVRLG